MEDKKKLMELIIHNLQYYSSDCEICHKMGWKCPVFIPENANLYFQPDTSACNFKENIYKTLTIEH